MPSPSRTAPARRPTLRAATPLRPATYAGVAAAAVSVAAAAVLRAAPALESVVMVVHLAAASLLYATGGALAARLGGDGWRAGLFAGLLDALVGHVVAFLLSAPPDPSRLTAPPGRELTPSVVAAMHLWGAVLGAVMAVGLGAVAGWAGGRVVRGRPTPVAEGSWPAASGDAPHGHGGPGRRRG